MTLSELAEKWEKERPKYERFATHVAAKLEIETFRLGVLGETSHRAKTIHSLLKKQLRWGVADPWGEFIDKAGVRLIIQYADAEEAVCRMIGEKFAVQRRIERKVENLGHDRVGYLGTHLVVMLREEDIQDEEFRGLVCEIQIHSGAQHLWAATSHDMLYKSDEKVPIPVKRSFYLLSALMELYDKELASCRAEIMKQDSHDSFRMLTELENLYLPLATTDYDHDLSIKVIENLKEAYRDTEIVQFGEMMKAFVAENRAKLEQIYHRYQNDYRNIMLFQPEALIVFERLAKHRPTKLAQVWKKTGIPIEQLEQLKTLW